MVETLIADLRTARRSLAARPGFALVVVLTLDPDQSFFDVQVMTDRIASGIWQQQVAAGVGALFLACWIPARRATRVDPLIALRAE